MQPDLCALFHSFVGTVWQLVGKIDGVGAAIGRLQQRGKKIVYVTNNSLRSDDEYRTKFAQSDIAAKVVSGSSRRFRGILHGIMFGFFLKEDVMHPALATIHYLQREKFKGLVYTIGSPVFRQTIAKAGFETIEGVSLCSYNSSYALF